MPEDQPGQPNSPATPEIPKAPQPAEAPQPGPDIDTPSPASPGAEPPTMPTGPIA